MSTVFTKASKLVKDSESLSFSTSGAESNCDPSCRVFAACYASRIERIYSGLRGKLERHEERGPLWVVSQALAQLRPKPLRWFRLSVDGSLPARGRIDATEWRPFVRGLRLLIERVQALGARVHIPIETKRKARTYRAALRGLGVVVRRSCQDDTLGGVMTDTDPRSWIVKSPDVEFTSGHISKAAVKDNAEEAFRVADDIRKQGQTAVVCPAIVSDSKCGKCTACANPSVDVILYPYHP